MYNKKAKKPSLFYFCYKRVVTSTFKKKLDFYDAEVQCN